jgi:hypothetical protein
MDRVLYAVYMTLNIWSIITTLTPAVSTNVNPKYFCYSGEKIWRTFTGLVLNLTKINSQSPSIRQCSQRGNEAQVPFTAGDVKEFFFSMAQLALRTIITGKIQFSAH